MLAWLLGGCTADMSRPPPRDADDPDDDPFADSGSSQPSRAAAASLGCDGTPLPQCDGPFTGATCSLPCSGVSSSEPGACGVDRYCHSDGSVYGLSTRNAVLYHGSPHDDVSVVESSFEGWIVTHAAELGLDEGLEPANIELQRLTDSRSSAGPLTIHRFSQRYRGLPVLAPDGVVTLVYGPHGAIFVAGAVIDNRTRYEHHERQAPAEKAELSMRSHASRNEQLPIAALEVVHMTPVAMPAVRAIGWVGLVRRKGGSMLARVIVDADPLASAEILPLWSYRGLEAPGLANTQGIQVRTLDPAGDLESATYDIESTMLTGELLLGSVDDVSSEIQLATERVVVLDLQGELVDDVASFGTRVLDPGGDFLELAGAGLSAQVVYHLFQGWYDLIDGHLTDPAAGTKQWESANLLYSNGTWVSDTPLGTFAPRVLAFTNASLDECPVQGVACMKVSGYRVDDEAVAELPELAHLPAGATHEESTGSIMLPGEGIEPVTFAHELGHVVDLFTGGGMTRDFAPDCGGACTLECVESTTDEAPPLSESIAQMLALLFLHQGFETAEFDYCPMVGLVSVNGDKAWTPGPCIPDAEDISLLQRPDACAKPGDYCDRPAEAGVEHVCCFDDEDLTECTIELSEVCPAGAVGPGGGSGTGTARAVPTGLCAAGPGYRTNSVYQAFWQLLNGQVCDPNPPFACEAMEWCPDVTPEDATTDAFLYALRVNALTYEQLFDAMAMYVACTYGSNAYEQLNAIACNHGIRDCGEPPPISCESCGNGVREGSETCDGTDWLSTHCEDLVEQTEGSLICDQSTCTLDPSYCEVPGLDSTAGTAAPFEEQSTSSTPGADTESDGVPRGSDGGAEGCGCRAPASRGDCLSMLLSLAWLGAWRRRRAA
jgi:hypothetical protein